MPYRQFAFILTCLLTCQLGFDTSPVSAQVKEKSQGKRLNGGFIQQLRSLPDEALQTLQSAERNVYGQAEPKKSATSSAPSPQSFPPQPSGRATLQRTHQSPWLERLSQSGSAAQPNSSVPPPNYRPSIPHPPAPRRMPEPRMPEPRVPEPRMPDESISEQSNSEPRMTPPTIAESRMLEPRMAEPRMPQPVARRPFLDNTSEPISQNFSDEPQGTAARGGFRLSDRPQVPESLPEYPGRNVDFPDLDDSTAAENEQPEIYKSNARLTPNALPSESQLEPSPLVQDHLQNAIPQRQGDAFTAESLQEAPRVSRVPLPKSNKSSRAAADPSANAPDVALPDVASKDAAGETSPSKSISNESQPQQVLPTESINATATSASRLGPTRITQAQLTSELPKDAVATNGESVSVPTQLANRPTAEMNRGDIEKPLPSTLPQNEQTGLPSVPRIPLPTAKIESIDASQTELLARGDANNGFTLPVLPSLPVPADVPSSAAAGLQAEPEFLSPPTVADSSVEDSLAKNSESPDARFTLPPARSGVSTSEGLAQHGIASSAKTSPHSGDQRLKMETPHVEVELNGPSNLPIGTPAEYQIVVRNADRIDLQGLILRLDIPAGVNVETHKPTHGEFEVEKAPDGLTMLTWGFEALPAGQSATAPMQLIAGSAKNFAVAMEWTLMPVSGSSQIDVSAPRLELALEGPAEVNFGQPNTYRLHVRNPGTAKASHLTVRLSAETYGSSAAEIPAIEPGEEEVIEVELTFNEQGAIRIVAQAQEQSGLESETAISVIVRQAKLAAGIVAPEVVYHSALADYQLQLTNAGDADAQDLRAVVQLPPGASLITAPPGAALSGRTLTWPIAKLVSGSSEAFSLQLKLTSDGANVVDFACSGTGSLQAKSSATTHVESVSDLKLVVNDPVAPAPVGGEVAYELMLTNRGSKTATNVKVIAQFSEGIEPLRGEGQACRVVPGQTFFDPIARIGAGESVNLKVFAKAAVAGTHRFRVEVRADESEVRLVQEESTQYLEAANRIAAPSNSSLMR